MICLNDEEVTMDSIEAMDIAWILFRIHLVTHAE